MEYRVTNISGVIPKTKVIPGNRINPYLDLVTYCIIRHPDYAHTTRQVDEQDKTIITASLNGRAYSTTEITPALDFTYDYSGRDERMEAVYRRYLGE